MKMRNLLLCIFLLSTYVATSQELDKVYLKNKEVVSGKVLNVTSENIEINPVGDKPFLIIKRADAELIIYSDNTIVNLSESKSQDHEKKNSTTKKRQSFESVEKYQLKDTHDKFSFRKQILDCQFVLRDEINKEDIVLITKGSCKYHWNPKHYGAGWWLHVKNIDLTIDLEVDNKNTVKKIFDSEDEASNNIQINDYDGEVLVVERVKMSMGEYWVKVDVTCVIDKGIFITKYKLEPKNYF